MSETWQVCSRLIFCCLFSVLVKGRVNIRLHSLSVWTPCLMLETSEVDCSASTSLNSSIVFISHLQSVSCFTLASCSYNCCVALLQPEGTLSSTELDAALVVMANIECTVYSTTKTLSY